MSYEICYSCVSHIGKIRRQNQDNFVCLNEIQHYTAGGTDGVIRGKMNTAQGGSFAVFDGMGGEECGEMAAYIAAEALREASFGAGGMQTMADYCLTANRAICSYAETHEISSMGTTAAVLYCHGDQIWLCNIGDSKIFLLSGDRFKQISQDHVSVPICGRKPPLSQNLGIPESEFLIEPYLAAGACRDGDRYLICSDGLTDMVSTERIEAILRSETDDSAADSLLREALDNGGRDNTTLILLHIKKQKASFLRKIFQKKAR